jgi:hypothetical protein
LQGGDRSILQTDSRDSTPRHGPRARNGLTQKIGGDGAHLWVPNTGVEQTGSDISIRYFGRKFGFATTTDERSFVIPVSQLRGLLAQLTWKRVGLFSNFHLAGGRRWRNAVRAQSRMRLDTSASWDDGRGRCAEPSEQRQQPTAARS